MKRELLDILACPVCTGSSSSPPASERGKTIGRTVEGNLTCEECSETYPIEDKIPKLLPPEPGGAVAASTSSHGQT